MMRMLLCILVLLSSARSQETGISIAGDIDSAHAMLFDVAINFHDGIRLADTSVAHLSEILTRVSTASTSAFPQSIRHPTWQNDQQNLAFALFQFDIFRSQSTSQDSIRNAFRELFYAFHNLCQPYSYQRAVSTAEAKVFLFAASITCECTRKLCDEYTAGLTRLGRKYEKRFDIVIIDSVTNSELMDKYEVNTIPTALAIDNRGKETGRFEGNDHTEAGLQSLIRTLGGAQ